MKTKIIASLLTIAAVLTIAASQRTTVKHEVVILQGYQSHDDYTIRPNGIKLYNSGSSAGAPKFNYNDNVAEALAALLDEGYTVRTASENGQTFVLIKQ